MADDAKIQLRPLYEELAGLIRAMIVEGALFPGLVRQAENHLHPTRMKPDRTEMQVLKMRIIREECVRMRVTITFRIIGRCFNMVGRPYDFLTSLTD